METEKRFMLKEDKGIELKIPPLNEKECEEALKPFKDFLEIQHSITTAIIDTQNKSMVEAVKKYTKENPNCHVNIVDENKLNFVIACFQLWEQIPNDIKEKVLNRCKDKDLVWRYIDLKHRVGINK